MKHSEKFEIVKRYYEKNLWNIEMVWNAAKNPPNNPWITVEEAQEITMAKFNF